MSENKTASMLQRVPVILAVTANSYGLELRAAGARREGAARAGKNDAGRRRDREKESGRH